MGADLGHRAVRRAHSVQALRADYSHMFKNYRNDFNCKFDTFILRGTRPVGTVLEYL